MQSSRPPRDAHLRPRRRSLVFATATALCSLPCLCIIGGVLVVRHIRAKKLKRDTPRDRERRAAREAARLKPEVLPPRLGRNLTIGRSEPSDAMSKDRLNSTTGVKEQSKTDDQLGSLFFKLPLEVRRQIYEEAIGGYTIHPYTPTNKKFYHTRCKIEACNGNPCRQFIKNRGAKDKWGAIELLSLARTCRKMYSEAIEILYTANSFEFRTLNQFVTFSLQILPERTRLIQRVSWREYESTSNITHYTNPWLVCNLPNDCCCISCLPETAYTDTRSHKWIVYMWLMREKEQLLESNAANYMVH